MKKKLLSSNNIFRREDSRRFIRYEFIKQLIIPEIEINEITQRNDEVQISIVDFYLPQTNLVIEIDGQQHKVGRLLIQ